MKSKIELHSRLAPTPSGFLHLGNGVNFVLTWLVTRQAGGKLSLRIDDMDATRSRVEYIQDIFETIEWLGIDYDFGPSSPDDFRQNFSQQAKIEYYREYLNQLETYPCGCSRKDILATSPSGIYPRTCLNKNVSFKEGNTSLRLRVSDEELSRLMGDFVIWRKDGLPSYQLVSLIEDYENKINLIIRGQDLLSSTKAQLYLARELSFSDFLETRFIHHDLIADDKNQKLSKSQGAYSLKSMRESLKSPSIVYQKVAKLLNLSSASTLLELKEAFHEHPYSL